MTCIFKRHLKRCLIIVVLFFHASMLSAQVVQVGRITEQNSDGKPIVGASAVCLSATDVQPATTDNSGIFLLSFKKHCPGDIIYNLRVTKPGFEIVNSQLLKSGIILTEKDTLKIVMARPEQLAEARAHYYDIIDHYHVGRHEATIAQLKKELEAAKITAAEYEQRATEAEQQLAKALEQAEHYADLFSRINKDDLDAVSRSAFQALSEGDVGRAIKIYENANAFGKMKEKIAQRDEADLAIKALKKQAVNEAELRMMIGGEENIQRAGDIFRTIAYCDSTSIANCTEYMHFLIDMGRYKEAYEFADEVFKRPLGAPGPISGIYNELGTVAHTQNDLDNAKKYLKISLNYAEKEKDEYRRTFHSNYPLHSLAITYYKAGDLDSALYYMECSLHCRKIMMDNDSTRRNEYANECNSLAVLYNRKNQFQEAMRYGKEAVKIGELACRSNPKHLPTLATYVSTVATIYWSMGQNDSTDYYFRQCLDIWENRMPYIMNFYKDSYAFDLIHYAKFNMEINHLEDAQKLLEKALTFSREGYEFSQEEFTPIIIEVLDELAKLSKAVGNEADEKRYREEADSYRN